MLVSKREKYIAIGVAGAVALLVLNSFVWDPYTEELTAIQESQDQAVQKLADDASTMVASNKLRKIWADMQSHGLKDNDSAADSQLQHALLDWAQQAGVVPQVLKSDQARKEGNFSVIGYHVTATGSMRTIARFLWALETTPIPIHISDVRITPQREGTDDLSVQLGVSTLSAPPGVLTGKSQITAANSAGVRS